MLLMFQTEDQIDEILDEGMDEFDQELHLPKELQTDDTSKVCLSLSPFPPPFQKKTCLFRSYNFITLQDNLGTMKTGEDKSNSSKIDEEDENDTILDAVRQHQ